MGPGLIAFFIAIGSAAWLYAKLQKYSGNNTKQSVIAGGISGLVIFIIAFYILHTFIK